MTKEDLMKFCDPEQLNISKPFTRGDFTYVTNRHLIIRVPKLEDVGEQEGNKIDIEKFWKSISDYPYFPITKISPTKYAQCCKCEGTGIITKCPECNGTGEVDLESDYNSYSCECESCDGTGNIGGSKDKEKKCDKCNGTGKIENKFDNHSLASGRYYQNNYLHWLKELPECLLAEAKDLDPAHFKFNGGDGFIMPVKV